MNRPTPLALALSLVALAACDPPYTSWKPPYTHGEHDVLQFLYSTHVPLESFPTCIVDGGCDIGRGLLVEEQTRYPGTRVALEATPLQPGAPFVGRVEVPVPGTLRLKSTSCTNPGATTHVCESETSCTLSPACVGYPVYVDVEGLMLGTHELVYRTSAGDEIDRIGLLIVQWGVTTDGGS